MIRIGIQTALGLSNLGKMRKRLGLTQKQLAALAGVSQSLIAKIESGKVDPAYSNVVKITEALENRRNIKRKRVNDIMTKELIYLDPDDRIDRAIGIMRKKDISQLPVFRKGVSVGSIYDGMFIDWVAEHGRNIKKMRVRDVMDESFPIVPHDSLIDVAVSLLKFYRAILVKKNGRITGIVTKADLIKAMK